MVPLAPCRKYISVPRYERRVESWFLFEESAERFTPEGRQTVRLVVTFGFLAPALARLRATHWAKPALASLSWVESKGTLRTRMRPEAGRADEWRRVPR